MSTPEWQVFVTALGQRDNAGDTALRRAYLNALREVGRLHVFVGDRPPAFTDNLGLRPADEVYRDSASWRRAVTSGLRRGHTLFAYSAGEISVDRHFGRNYLRTWLPLRLARARGNRSVHTGVGVRADDTARRLVGRILRTTDLVTWRDPWSADLMGVGEVQPDWAFREGSQVLDANGRRRDVLAVALRWDRPLPPAGFLTHLRDAATDRGLRLVCVAQTERDGARAAELAGALGCESLAWTGPGHAANEAAVRAVYARSAVVMSDRLHGVVFGMTEGAVPVIVASDPTAKAVRTVSVVHPGALSVAPTGAGATLLPRVLDAALTQRDEVAAAVTAARTTLTDVVGRIREVTR